jgi:hypothetical protein
LGKLDDRKRDYILSYPRLVKFFIDYAGVTDNFFTAWLEFKKRRKDALVNNLINFVENGKKNNLSHNELLSGSQRKMVESFDVTSKSVQILPVRMTIYLGGAIAMSLIALMFMSNGHGQETWAILVSAVSFMIASAYSFHRFWSDMHQLTSIVDSQYLIMTDLKAKMEDGDK